MKTVRRLIALMLIIVLCMSIAITASAAVSSKEAGIYGTLSCTSQKRGTDIYGKTTVTTNPDNAYLLVKYTINLSGGTQTKTNGTSQRGVTSFEYIRSYLNYTTDGVPTYVQFCGEVRGGSQSPSAYVTTTRGYSVDFS